ncbi:CUB domain-containing protein [Bdellovibrionota bacterium FG-1]
MQRSLLIAISLAALILTGCKASPTESPTALTAVDASPSPSVSASATPKASPTALPGASPSASASASATPSAIPSASPTATATATPSATPTATPTYSLALAVKAGSSNSITANGSSTTVLQALVLDQDLNPGSGQSVTLNIPASGGTTSSPATSNGSGIAEFTITSSTVAGAYSYTATANAVTSSSTALTFTSVAPTLTVSPMISLVGLTETETLSTSGGTGPYSYSIVSGPGDVNAASGLFTASSGSVGAYVKIKAQDSLGAVGYGTVKLGIAAASYNMCAGTTATSASGTLYDSGGAGADYNPSENCGFLISSLGDITASFDSFGTENNYDFVRIYDGSNASGRLLGSFSGSITPGNQTATSGQMYVAFTSDGSVQGTGFVMHWTTTGPTETSPVVANFSVSPWIGLSGALFNFTDSSSNSPRTWNWSTSTLAKTANPSSALTGAGLTPVSLTVSNALGTDIKTNNVYLGPLATDTFKMCTDTTATTRSGILVDSGDTTANYNPSENCSLLIQPAEATSITLSFSSFATEPNYDRLQVYDGTNSSGTLLGTFSGSTAPAPVTGTSGSLYITFTSDGSVQAAGFNASWTSSGPVITPVANFFASQTSVVVGETITFRDISNYGPTSWAWDFENTGATDSTQQNPSHAFATAGAKTVKLTSTNAVGSNSKTKTAYITVSNFSKMCTDTSSNATSGILFDSGGPSGNYSDNENCGFLIQLGAGHTVQLGLSAFSLEEGADFLKIYDGADATGTPLHTGAGFTGGNLPSSVMAQSGSMYLVMTSDSSVTRPGFKANWSEVGVGTIANLSLWLKADSLSLNEGDPVATWTDSSGNNHSATQADASKQPTYSGTAINNHPAVNFAGSPRSMRIDSNLSIARPFTAFIVNVWHGGATGRTLSSVSTNWLLGFWQGNVAFFNGGFVYQTAATQNVTYLSEAINTNAYSKYFVHGVLAATSGAGGDPGTLELGSSVYSEYNNGDIAEVVIYSSELSDSDRATVETYLNLKYSIW